MKDKDFSALLKIYNICDEVFNNIVTNSDGTPRRIYDYDSTSSDSGLRLNKTVTLSSNAVYDILSLIQEYIICDEETLDLESYVSNDLLATVETFKTPETVANMIKSK